MADIEPQTVFNEIKNWLSKALPESCNDAKTTL